MTSRVNVVRARFLVAASFVVAALAAGSTVVYASMDAAPVAAIVPIVATGLGLLSLPVLLRRGVALGLLSAVFIGATQLGLLASISSDRGLSDGGILWLVITPLLGALLGGARLGWGASVSAGLGVLGVLAAERAGYAFPDVLSPEHADLFFAGNAIGATLFVAALAQLYEGPLVRHFRHLSSRLSATNEALRRELAEREAAQARAEAASRAKDALLANMSHEFRTPLTAILGFTDLLDEEVEPEHRPFVASIDRGAHRLMGTLDGVLGLAWIESGGTGLDVQAADLRAQAEAVVDALRPRAAARGLTVTLTGTTAAAHADPAAVQRVLHALVDNAVRFTESGGVTLALSDADEHTVEIAVSDTGVGMTEDFAACAFEPFRQASEGHARTHEGVGVGLTMAKRLVELMGGAVAVVTAPGEGTTVRVRLPAASSEPGAHLVPPSAWSPRASAAVPASGAAEPA